MITAKSQESPPLYPRHLAPLLRDMLGEFRVVYVTGPRQSGKTTLARSVAAKLGMRYLTLDDPAVRSAAATDPHGFVRSFECRPVVLDEFQHVPELVPAIKEASDRLASEPPSNRTPGAPRKGLFLLTGSADLFRSARTQETLPGHMARLELLPLSIVELRGGYQNLVDLLLEGDLEPGRAEVSGRRAPPTRRQIARLILLGGYPEIQGMSRRARGIWFRSYAEGRFLKDFDTLYSARGDYHSRLRVLAPYLAGRTANLIRYVNLANDLELNDKLVKSYIEVLELLFLVRRVPAYRRNPARRMAVRMPKLHFVDTGLASNLLGLSTEARLLASSHYGALLETMLFTECAKHVEWAGEEVGLYHFRDRRKREVDMVLERPDGRIVGVEVKASASLHGRDFSGLVALAEFAGTAFERGVILYTGAQTLSFHQGRTRLYALPLARITSSASGAGPVSRR